MIDLPAEGSRKDALEASAKERTAEERLRTVIFLAAGLVMALVLACLVYTIQAAQSAEEAAQQSLRNSERIEVILAQIEASGATRQQLLEHARRADEAAAKRGQLILDLVCLHLGVRDESECANVFIREDGSVIPAEELPPRIGTSPRAADGPSEDAGRRESGSERRKSRGGLRTPPPSDRPSSPPPVKVPTPEPGPEVTVTPPKVEVRVPTLPLIDPPCTSIVCIKENP